MVQGMTLSPWIAIVEARTPMDSIIYLVGLIVIVMLILSMLGLR
jgi:hypothetical protein